MATKKILLFDIDGTLISADGAGRRSLDCAFRDVLGSEADRVDLFKTEFAGRTDPWIVRTALLSAGLAADGDVMDEIFARHTVHLPTELSKSANYRLHPGVRTLLDALRSVTDAFLGLGTGNMEPAAYVKLAHGQIDHYFDYGGFGSDHDDRAELLRVGMERGVARAGVSRAACRVVVIGDTVHDIAAARAIHVETVAVATSVYHMGALEEAGADLVVETLADPRVLDALTRD